MISLSKIISETRIYNPASGPTWNVQLSTMTEEPHVNLAVLKLNFEARTVARSVASGRLFASNIDFLRMEAKPLRFHKTEGANNHIKQGDTLIFAHNPIGVTDKRLPAMLTNAIHAVFYGKEHAICYGYVQGSRRHCVTMDFLSPSKK